MNFSKAQLQILLFSCIAQGLEMKPRHGVDYNRMVEFGKKHLGGGGDPPEPMRFEPEVKHSGAKMFYELAEKLSAELDKLAVVETEPWEDPRWTQPR